MFLKDGSPQKTPVGEKEGSAETLDTASPHLALLHLSEGTGCNLQREEIGRSEVGSEKSQRGKVLLAVDPRALSVLFAPL